MWTRSIWSYEPNDNIYRDYIKRLLLYKDFPVKKANTMKDPKKKEVKQIYQNTCFFA